LQGADGALEAAQDGRDGAGAIAQTQMTAPTGKAVVADGGMVTVTGLP
jgi:hypothetical protein